MGITALELIENRERIHHTKPGILIILWSPPCANIIAWLGSFLNIKSDT